MDSAIVCLDDVNELVVRVQACAQAAFTHQRTPPHPHVGTSSSSVPGDVPGRNKSLVACVRRSKTLLETLRDLADRVALLMAKQRPSSGSQASHGVNDGGGSGNGSGNGSGSGGGSGTGGRGEHGVKSRLLAKWLARCMREADALERACRDHGVQPRGMTKGVASSFRATSHSRDVRWLLSCHRPDEDTPSVFTSSGCWYTGDTPCGHTPYSWRGANTVDKGPSQQPVGHTQYSWQHEPAALRLARISADIAELQQSPRFHASLVQHQVCGNVTVSAGCGTGAVSADRACTTRSKLACSTSTHGITSRMARHLCPRGRVCLQHQYCDPAWHRWRNRKGGRRSTSSLDRRWGCWRSVATSFVGSTLSGALHGCAWVHDGSCGGPNLSVLPQVRTSARVGGAGTAPSVNTHATPLGQHALCSVSVRGHAVRERCGRWRGDADVPVLG